MKFLSTILLSFFVFIAQAQTIAAWDFENTTTPTAPSTNPVNGAASLVSVGATQAASFLLVIPV